MDNQEVAIDMHDAQVISQAPTGNQNHAQPAEPLSHRRHEQQHREDTLKQKFWEKLTNRPEVLVQHKTIFRVPGCPDETHQELFEPKMVSIGPYHHGKTSLSFMQQQKWSFVRDFLPADSIDRYLDAMREMEAKARQCYSEDIDMESDEFVEMLLLDGCFLLEHLLRNSGKSRNINADAFCDVAWGLPNMINDLILLENQIPFFVIHKLFNIREGRSDNPSDCELGRCKLLELCFAYPPHLVCYAMCDPIIGPPDVTCRDINHLLHLLHACAVRNYTPNGAAAEVNHTTSHVPITTQINSNSVNHTSTLEDAIGIEFENPDQVHKWISTPVGINCATKLYEAGVKFKRKSKTPNIFDITFSDGTLEIPFVMLTNCSKIMFANAAAFEQTPPQKNQPAIVTGYMGIMDELINTAQDVIVLEQSKILEIMVRDEESAAAFFNDMSHFFLTKKYEPTSLLMDIRKYSNSTLRKWRAKLIHDYFSNPWSVISVMAAGFLLVLAFLQVYYSAK